MNNLPTFPSFFVPKQYQSPSPDEVALLNLFSFMGISLQTRSLEDINIESDTGKLIDALESIIINEKDKLKVNIDENEIEIEKNYFDKNNSIPELN